MITSEKPPCNGNSQRMKCFLSIHLDVWEKKSYQWKPKGLKTMFKFFRYVLSKGSDDMGWFSASLEILPLSFYLLSYMQSIKPYMTLKRAHWKTLISFWNRASFTGIWSWFFSWILIKKHCFNKCSCCKKASSFEGWGCLGWSLHYPNHPNPNTPNWLDQGTQPTLAIDSTTPEVLFWFRNPG